MHSSCNLLEVGIGDINLLSLPPPSLSHARLMCFPSPILLSIKCCSWEFEKPGSRVSFQGKVTKVTEMVVDFDVFPCLPSNTVRQFHSQQNRLWCVLYFYQLLPASAAEHPELLSLLVLIFLVCQSNNNQCHCFNLRSFPTCYLGLFICAQFCRLN